MLIEEARWLKKVLQELGSDRGSMLLDIGSSTEYFRRVEQPYIDYYVFWPLRKKGVDIIHIDARTDEGIDIVCDISDPGSHEAIANISSADIVLCSNLLEHVLDRDMVAARLAQLTKPGGHLIVTVPHVYRYHEDPIDTLYRPTNKELEALLSLDEIDVVRSEILDVDCGYLDIPDNFLAYLLFRVRRFVRLTILRRPVKFDRCKVSIVVLKRATQNLQP